VRELPQRVAARAGARRTLISALAPHRTTFRLTRAALVVVSFVLFASSADARASAPSADLSVVPQPRHERVAPGLYRWASRVRIAAAGTADRDAAELLRGYLAENGVSATVAGRSANAGIVLQASKGYDARLGDEGYVLNVTRNRITMRANTPRGLFYALQTLDQISKRSGRHFVTRFVTVVDRPEYRWRGIHLDVARHFFPVPVVKRYIDVAAHFKLNVFHWHLTDDQAWRLDSGRYPALTAGVAPGEHVVTDGVLYLEDNDPIDIVPAAARLAGSAPLAAR